MKRFTETTKWDDPWFRRLSPRLKCLWQFFCDRCDAAGVIDPDWELASFQIGEPVTEADMASFEGRIERLERGKWWIQRFVPFQYGNLSPDCKAHGPALSSLDAHGLKDRVSKGYPKGFQTPKEKEKVKVKDKEKDKDTAPEKTSLQSQLPDNLRGDDFIKAWNRYIAFRKASKIKPLLDASVIEQWKKLSQFGPAISIEAINATIANGWQGLFPEKIKPGGNGIPKPLPSRPDRFVDPTQAAVDKFMRDAEEAQ